MRSALSLLLLAAAPVLAGERPNVVVFSVDDLGTLDAGCYGSADLHTPNIDRLAAGGVRFERAYAHTVCCPSRALLLTGRHPQRGGVNSWTQGNAHDPEGVNLHLGEVTLAEVLRDAGYRTALAGKWHLGASLEHGPTRQGFDEFFGHRGGFIDNYNHFFLHGRGFHDLYRGTEEVFARGSYFPDLTVDAAVRFLRANHESPFFLYVAFNLPHYPEQADSKFDERHAGLPEPRRSYARVVSTVDDRIGRILAVLEELELTGNTIVVFLSDNGHSTESIAIRVDDHASGLPRGHDYGANGGGGNTGRWRGAKGTFFEGGLRVPAIVSFPGRLPAGEVRRQAVHVGDLFPTVLELCGVPPPDVELDGRSLAGVLADADAPEPHDVLHWQWYDRWAVMEGTRKLIGGADPAADFLGDLSGAEPERVNGATREPEVRARLRALHEEWALDVSPRAGLARVRAALARAGEPVEGLEVFTQLVPSSGRAYVCGETLYFAFAAPAAERLSFPRLNNPIERVRLIGGDELQLRQDNRRWWVRLPAGLGGEVVLALDVVGSPRVAHGPRALVADEAGTFVLPAHEAAVFGEKLCYEPQPHKNTLGYWVRPEDWARWTIEVSEAGTFEVSVLQGCGAGHGGSEVDVHLGDQALRFVVEDTGHFQAFERRVIGKVTLDPGTRHVELRPRTRARGAVCDVRELRLDRAD